MAIRGVRLNINAATAYRATNAPGGLVNKFAHEIGRGIVRRGIFDSPVNDPLNALHRLKWGTGKPPGTYKASWYYTTKGSNQYESKVRAGNRADHAVFVEKGRSASSAGQVFSWSKAPFVKMRAGSRPFKRPGWRWWLISAGYPNSLLERTGARTGKHILEHATRDELRKWRIPFKAVR